MKKKKQTRLEKKMLKRPVSVAGGFTVYFSPYHNNRYFLEHGGSATIEELKSFHKKLGKLLEEVE